MSRKNQLTPKANKLYTIANNLVKIGRQLNKENAEARKRLQMASDFVNSEEYIKSTTVNLQTYRFIMSQVRLQKLKPKARRFTLDDKIFALSLYKQGRKKYKLLQKVFALPARNTLSRLLYKLPLNVGINDKIFNSFKKQIEKMDHLDKYCILIFDEIALSANLQYNAANDLIESFEDIGDGVRRCKFADHALVFMARGIHKKWKQPLCFYFLEQGMKSQDLVPTIKSVIRAVRRIGLTVVATICDQHATNVAAINSLRNETQAECLRCMVENRYFGFTVDGVEVVPLYDPPHLLKGIINRLLDSDILFKWNRDIQKASW